MLARTHGQTASPTTLGKEFANVYSRLNKAYARLTKVPVNAKLNGAVGNWNAHISAFPKYDWPQFSETVITQSLGLDYQEFSTQIEPHDSVAEYLDAMAHCNIILLDLARDIWSYISIAYFGQSKGAKQVGSSTMPHKVNPIDFENAEGNIGVANALLRFMADKLPVSRWQRDLSDSTVLRNLGVALGHSVLAWDNLLLGLGKIHPNQSVITNDLDSACEVLAEAVQTVMRKHGLAEPYEKLKAFTQGKKITAEMMHEFIHSLDLPQAEKDYLLALNPQNYTGIAADMALKI